MKPDESIKAEDIDGYRGGDDLESLLQFIEAKPKGQPAHPEPSGQMKVKRSRRTDRKSKRSRTPSVNTPSQEKSPDTSQSQKTSRASSATSRARNEQENSPLPDHTVGPDSVTTVKNSLIVVNSQNNPNNAKKPVKKPKKQAGWLVDFNNDIGSSKSRVKSKPPSGKITENTKNKEENATTTINTTITTKEILNIVTNEDSSDEPNSVQDEILLIPDEPEIKDQTPEPQMIKNDQITDQITDQKSATNYHVEEETAAPQNDVCFNYASILKFIKQGNS